MSQRIFGAALYAFHTKNTFRAVFPVPRIIGYVYIHRTYTSALSAVDAFVFFACDADQREAAHGLQEDGDRADVLTERPIILENKGKDDPDSVIRNIPGYECMEHDSFYVAGFCKKERRHKDQ